MKRIIALGLLVAGTSALADSSRNIYDLMYLPKAGTAYGISQANYADARLMDSDTKIDGEIWNVNQSLGYSLSDMLSLQASLGYGQSNYDSGVSDSSGISDPLFNARFRLMEGEYLLDFLGEAAISLGDHEIDKDNEGDARNGGHEVAAGAQFGRKTEGYQWAFSGLLRYNLESTTDDKSSGVKTKDDAHFGVDLGGDFLVRTTAQSNLHLLAKAMIEQEYDDNKGGSTASLNTYTWGGEYQYLVSSDLMARAGISYSLIKGAKIDQNDVFMFSVGANYQF